MDIPASPGNYVLVLYLDHDCTIAVGRLGEFLFRAGYYLYVGSARGPGGLRARLMRHLRGAERLRWHVDYLRHWTQPVAVWYNVDTQRRECQWRAALQETGLSVAVTRFGSSDCRCPGHLLYSCSWPDSTRLAGYLVVYHAAAL
jgi:Uri superfamily endonuclease